MRTLVVIQHEISLFCQLLQLHKQLGMQNASYNKWRESSAISNGTIRSISLYKITCSKHQTRPYDCDMVDSQSVRRLLVQEIQEAEKLLKLLADHLQRNVQIQSGEEFQKIVVSNDQCYVSIKPKGI